MTACFVHKDLLYDIDGLDDLDDDHEDEGDEDDDDDDDDDVDDDDEHFFILGFDANDAARLHLRRRRCFVGVVALLRRPRQT